MTVAALMLLLYGVFLSPSQPLGDIPVYWLCAGWQPCQSSSWICILCPWGRSGGGRGMAISAGKSCSHHVSQAPAVPMASLCQHKLPSSQIEETQMVRTRQRCSTTGQISRQLHGRRQKRSVWLGRVWMELLHLLHRQTQGLSIATPSLYTGKQGSPRPPLTSGFHPRFS